VKKKQKLLFCEVFILFILRPMRNVVIQVSQNI